MITSGKYPYNYNYPSFLSIIKSYREIKSLWTEKTIGNKKKIQLANKGLEPLTFALLARRSNQLS